MMPGWIILFSVALLTCRIASMEDSESNDANKAISFEDVKFFYGVPSLAISSKRLVGPDGKVPANVQQSCKYTCKDQPNFGTDKFNVNAIDKHVPCRMCIMYALVTQSSPSHAQADQKATAPELYDLIVDIDSIARILDQSDANGSSWDLYYNPARTYDKNLLADENACGDKCGIFQVLKGRMTTLLNILGRPHAICSCCC